MQLAENPTSLGRRPTQPANPETTPKTSLDAITPINAKTWKEMEALRIAATLNTASGLDHTKMTADIEHGLLKDTPEEIYKGVFKAESPLFIGDWFDPKLDGSPGGIVHGADFMFMISKLMEEATYSEIASVTEIRFTGVVKNQVDVYLSTGPEIQDSRKPVMTAKIQLKNGENVTIMAFEQENTSITARSASNTFVQHLCVKPLTNLAAETSWTRENEGYFIPPANFEIELETLTAEQQSILTQFYRKNPTGITASTAMDIVITGAQVLAELGEKAGGIPQQNALGAGFSNVTLPPLAELINGCKLRLTVLKDKVRTTARAEFWPIQFEFLDINDNNILGQGTFNWVNRLEQQPLL